jgi:hypothetical protein
VKTQEGTRTAIRQEVATSGVAETLRRRVPPRLCYGGLAIVFVTIWPFLFHYRLVFSIHGSYQPVGNDFGALYYVYKPYLLATLADGHVPLWMPQEAGGFSFVVNPFTQALYPGNLAALAVAEHFGHWGALEEQRFAVAAVSVLALCLYLTLRKLGLSPLPAALAAIVVASSYKVTETLRFPNATHAIACAAVAVLAIVHLRVVRRASRRALLGLVLAVAVFSLATAGYPYYLVYFFLLLPPVLLWLEFGSPGRYRAQRGSVVTFLVTTMVAIGVAIVAVLPYLKGMQHVLVQTTDRRGDDWAYSVAHAFDWLDYAGSLVLPQVASPEGWFYFGTAGIVLVCVALFVLHREAGLRRYSRSIAALCLWIGWIMFFGLNASNPLFRVAWETLPAINSLRVWGRINIFLVFPLAIALGLSLEVLLRRNRGIRLSPDEGRRRVFVALCAAGGILLCEGALALALPVDPEFTASMAPYYDVPGRSEQISATLGIAGLLAAVLFALVVSRKNPRVSRRLMQGLCMALVVVWMVQIHGARSRSWMWVAAPVPATVAPADLPIGDAPLAEIAARALRSNRLGPAESPVFDPAPPWSTATYANWHYDRYVGFLNDPRIDAGAKNRLLGVTSRTRFFFVPGPADPRALRAGAVRLERPRALTIDDYDGSRAVVDVDTDAPGALVFADNWDDDWRATVDGRPAQVDIAFKTFKSVRVPKGRTRVAFSYCPFSAPVYRSLC